MNKICLKCIVEGTEIKLLIQILQRFGKTWAQVSIRNIRNKYISVSDTIDHSSLISWWKHKNLHTEKFYFLYHLQYEGIWGENGEYTE